MKFLRSIMAGVMLAFSAIAEAVSPSGGQLLLINPRKRRARRKMSAKQLMYFGKGRKRNPRRRRHAHKARRRNPIRVVNLGGTRRRHRASRRRRNPISLHNSLRSFSGGSVAGIAKNAALGAGGALAVDVIMGQAMPYLPASLQTPNVYPFVKAGAAVVLGVVGRKFLGSAAVKMAEGSLICTARDFMRAYVPASLTLGYANPGYIPPVPNNQNLAKYLDGVGGNSVDEMAGTGMYVAA